KILQAYNFLVLTDTYGDIPFTGALDVENNPHAAFDDSKTVVYPGILEMLFSRSHEPTGFLVRTNRLEPSATILFPTRWSSISMMHWRYMPTVL
ncbi:SusD/RagB family nutrient-binding outer membrane lipoprotein, partial [Acinetobacter sp. 163]|nr:SusD/RagB family nutrient-binding outer membrane lipoprotein [Acinetobacter sp. 163]